MGSAYHPNERVQNSKDSHITRFMTKILIADSHIFLYSIKKIITRRMPIGTFTQIASIHKV